MGLRCRIDHGLIRTPTKEQYYGLCRFPYQIRVSLPGGPAVLSPPVPGLQPWAETSLQEQEKSSRDVSRRREGGVSQCGEDSGRSKDGETNPPGYDPLHCRRLK